MQTVKASVILDDAYRLIGWDAGQLDERDLGDARAALSRALQKAWEEWWWELLMVCQRVQCAQSLPAAGQFRNQGVTYYSPGDDWYYIALRFILEDPVVDGVTNTLRGWAKWEECARRMAWQAQSYAVGDQVSWGGQAWQWYDGTETGLASANTDVPGTSVRWLVVPEWWPVVPYREMNGNPDLVGPLVGPCGKVRSVSIEDPRTTAGPREFRFEPTADGARVLGLTVGRPWVDARRVTPVLDGDAWDEAASYEATGTEDLVFES